MVKTSVRTSPISGLGLFAEEFIKKGTITWEFHPKIDIYFSDGELESFSSLQREFLNTYAVVSKESGRLILSVDDARFTNHSATKNNLDVIDCGDTETCVVANRDIEIGEELLINYKEIDKEDASSKDSYLNE